MKVTNDEIRIVILWSILGFFIYSSLHIANALLENLLISVGYIMKLKPSILKYYAILSNFFYVGFWTFIWYRFVRKADNLNLTETKIDFPTRFAKLIGIIAVSLYIFSYIISLFLITIFERWYFEKYDETYQQVYSLARYSNMIGTIISLILVLLIFLKLIKLYNLKSTEANKV